MPSWAKNYLHNYFQPFQGAGELNSVKYLIMDMHIPYKLIGRIYMKKAGICADSFHVIKQLNDSLSKLRIRIMKRYDTDSIEYYLLKHWKFLLFDRTINLDNRAKFNKKLNRYINYRQLLDLILSIDPQLDTAWHLKEHYTNFNSSASLENAQSQLEDLIKDFVNANIPEFEKFTTAISNWQAEIVNFFASYVPCTGRSFCVGWKSAYFLRNLYSEWEKKAGKGGVVGLSGSILVFYFSFGDGFEVLAVGRFSVGGALQQFLFPDEIVDICVSLNAKYIVKRKAFSFSTDNVKLVRLFHLLRTQAVRAYHCIQKFLLC